MVWRDAVLRSAGFPAAGLDVFAAPELAARADRHLDGKADLAGLESAFAAELARTHRTASELMADPLFREAVTWQNADAAQYLARDDQPDTSHGRQREKMRDNTIARYWQRYCGKNDTIGFFGPVCWVTLDADAPGIEVRPGAGLLRLRQSRYEFWATQEYAGQVAADPVVRPWLPVGPHPHVRLDGDRVLRAGAEPLPVTAAEARLFARCDGRRAAAEIVDGEDDLAALARLVAKGVLWWGIDLPQSPEADQVLRSVLSAIPDAVAVDRALAGLRRLDAALADVGAAAGDAGKLGTAIHTLGAEFAAVTGQEATRRAGEMYAGRTVCYEDTVRDLDVTFGRPLLEALAGPFDAVLLPAARWLSVAVAETYQAAFGELYEELAGPGGHGVPLDEFWLAARPLFGTGAPPASQVAGQFALRWSELFRLDQVRPEARHVELHAAVLAERAAELFAASRPAWPGARIHSPDLHICATSAEAVSRGEFSLVLGEMHAVWPTLDCAVFVDRHPDPARLHAAAAADIGRQVRLAYPDWCPPFTARIASVLHGDDDLLTFSAVPGLDPERLLPVMALTVTRDGGDLKVTGADGREFALFDMFAVPIAFFASQLFRPGDQARHTPRLTIDRLVVARETWRTTVGESGLAAKDRLAEYLAARRLRRALGLPDKVFVKIRSEVKPVYADLTSLRYVSALSTMVRSARQRTGDETEIVITEMLPTAEHAWLPDASGRRYCSELRIQFRDPVPASRERRR